MQWREHLAQLSSTRSPCVLGIGNRLHGDDAAGPLLCDRLVGRFGGVAIDAGVAPENHLERVVACATGLVIVVDAADFGGAPGDVRLLPPDALIAAGVSTHACSPKMLGEYLTARRDDSPTVLWLVIQPETNNPAELSPAVAKGLDRLTEGLCGLWPARSKS